MPSHLARNGRAAASIPIIPGLPASRIKMGELHRVCETAIGHHRSEFDQPRIGEESRGGREPISSRISPRSKRLRAGGGSFGYPACGPPRQVLSWKPSATVG
jgi:hypothetical protein